MPNIPIISFNSGEVSPKIDARADVEKYDSACRTLENMIPIMYGPADRRPGTEYIYEAKNSPQGVRLIPFIYSSEIAYMCEFGNLYIRFYYDGAILTDDSGDPVEVVSPYLVGDLPELQYDQIGDTMWLVHGDYPQMKLTRTTATSFSLDEIVFEDGPFITRNDVLNADGITLTSSVTAAAATGTLTASGAVFDATHVGALFKLIHPRVTTSITQAANGTSDAIDVEGDYLFKMNCNGNAIVKLERNENSLGWETFRPYTVKNGDTAIQLTKTETQEDVQYRITVSDLSGTMNAELLVYDTLQDGIVRIDSVTSSTVAGITVLSELASTDATTAWSEGSWSGYRGYPAALCFCENRCCYASTDYDPQNVWLSKTDKYENFDEGLNAADSFSVFVPTTNEIRWIAALKALCVGTSGDEWTIQSNELDTPITPTSYTVKQQTSYGSAPVQPVKVGDSILFLDYVRRKVREFTPINETYGKYAAPDLTALAEHITESGLVAMAHQRNPDSILWSVRADGTLDSMSYEREQNVVAWARHLLGEATTDTSEVTGVGASDTPITYISENGVLWYLPINDMTMLTLDADSVARNVGGGIVGLSCTGHPFKSGDILWINGTTNYSASAKTLTSGTTDDELQFENAYVAETFDGSETIQKYITLQSGEGRMVQDSEGNMYYGHNWYATSNTCVTKIDLDGNKTYDFLTPEAPWPVYNTSDVCRGIAISADDLYLYLLIVATGATNDNGYVLKFNLSTGAEIWRTTYAYGVTSFGGYDLAIDSSGNAYAPMINGHIKKFDSADGSNTFLTYMGEDLPGSSGAIASGCNYAVVVDDDMGIVIAGGYTISVQEADGTYAYNLAVRTFDDSTGDQLAVGGWYLDATWKTAYINTGCILTHGGYIYVLCAPSSVPTLYKIEWTGSALNVVASTSGPSYGVGFYEDSWGNLVVVNQNYTTKQSSILYYYDWDLNYLGKIDNMKNTVLDKWAYTTGGAHLQGNAVFWPRAGNVPSGNDYNANGIVQSVAVMPSTDEDEVWVAVQRYINGSARRYIERMKPRALTTLEDCFFVDCGLTVENDPASTTITGLDHLIGEEVKVLGDGTVYTPTAAVDASGSITISTAVSVAQVGLAYRYKLKPMRMDISTGQGTSHGSLAHIAEMAVSFLNTMNAQYGVDYDNLYDVDWSNPMWVNSTEITGLFTGIVVVNVDGGFDLEHPLIISGNDPLPCSVRGIVPRMNITGR